MDCTLKHDSLAAASFAMSLVDSYTTTSQGFVYAGTRGNLLKVGYTRGCPFCRAKALVITLDGFVFSEDARGHERYLHSVLGIPAAGREWFSNPESRMEWMVDRGHMQTLSSIEQLIFTAIG